LGSSGSSFLKRKNSNVTIKEEEEKQTIKFI
jgi:hypothetical protein